MPNPDTTEPRGCPIPGACSALVEIAHQAAQIAQLKHALSEVKLAIEMTAGDVIWTRQACPETACDFITRTLESIYDAAE